ncbi:hypothetical protein LOTGIDRAFT_131784 [Lottia gigantea]|uniref:Sphingomyelin phosphodiesterase n=1 Tax=Lottia gigantea TaxID=225164 RepID=V3ZK93_LOTGI|nr:hypothetical protein LOTGIDRAFT_131784 [Lottia gigantea]ESO84682.1 hypothetical protein LOTGIDRAFT_131784 [Lottia gigantea]
MYDHDLYHQKILSDYVQNWEHHTNQPYNWNSAVTCDVCKGIVQELRSAIEAKAPRETLLNISNFFCVHFKIEDVRVCKLVIEQYKDVVFGVIEQSLLSPDEICAQLIPDDDCGVPYNPKARWNVTLSKTPKPPVKPTPYPKPGSPTMKILLLTDMHLDLDYQVGSNADCQEPLCCRVNDGTPAPDKKGAGFWGDYRHCDLSPHMFYNMMEYLKSIQDQFDMIYFTGDIPAHNIWNQTRVDQLVRMRTFISAIEKYLPDKPIYFAAGNHESSPCNIYAPPFVKGNMSQDWLYGAFAEVWTKWMPLDTIDTILKGGYYTVSPFPGLRIVSINSNYGTTDNWWLLVNNTDPAGQLQWLSDVLQQAEDNNEMVHILMHHPAKHEQVKQWSWNFYTLINRYENIIKAHFNGHSHDDFFNVIYDSENASRPIGVGYVPGSGTTYNNLNPGFRIYTVDGNYTGSTWAPLDWDNYVAEISKSSAETPPAWVKEYSPRSAYGLKSLNPSEWDDLINRMNKNDTLFQSFLTFRYKLATHGPCKGGCVASTLCDLKTSRTNSPDLCKDLY